MIGIRREDKSKWEARVPLVPDDIRRLRDEHGLVFHLESSPNRVFPDDDFRAVGAVVTQDLAECPIVIGIKEIPKERLEPRKTYVFFSHTIKGQPANMPMLCRLMELGCQLIDYERVVDDQGRRLVFFGRFAGLAGMIDTLWALGQRLQHEGADNPFTRVQLTRRYRDLAHAKREIARVGEAIRRDGLPQVIRPFVCGLTGYGHVSQGAQEILDLLPVQEISPDELSAVPPSADVCYKVVFREEHMVEPTDPSGRFQLQEYYDSPERYRAKFFSYLRHLTLMVNCIVWSLKYPRLVTCDQLRELYGQAAAPRLRVIGDISCDLNGSVECTVKATDPGSPVYVYEPATGQVREGVVGHGPVILAVDFLPCELAVDASNYFSGVLSGFVPRLARADYAAALPDSGLPPELQRATILWHGELTEPYRYLEKHVK